MACQIIRSNDSSGSVVDATLTNIHSILSDVQSKVTTSPQKSIKNALMDAGIIAPDGRLSSFGTKDSYIKILEANAMAKMAFGVTSDLFTIKPEPINYGGRPSSNLPSTKYMVEINPGTLEQLKEPQSFDFKKLDDHIQFVEEVNRAMNNVATKEGSNLFAEEVVNVVAQEPLVSSNYANQVDIPIESKKTTLSTSENATTPKTAVEQIKFLTQSFKAAGIDVTIKFDTELPEKGKVVSENGKVTVFLNPVTMTEDTHIHEFAHILVELLGIDHPAVKSAIAELKDTVLYNDVKEAYPELSEEALNKEVVVTAIGLTGAKINRKNPSKFQVIVNRLLRAFSRLFNTTESSVEKLTQMLLKDQFKSEIYNKPLASFEAKSKASTNYNDLALEFSKLKDEVKIVILNKIQQLERQVQTDLTESEISKLKLMKDGLDTIASIEGLSSFVNYAYNLAISSEALINDIFSKKDDTNLTTDERVDLLNKLFKLTNNIRDFYGGTAEKDSLMSKLNYLVQEKLRIHKSKATTPEQLANLEKMPWFQNLTNFEKQIALASGKIAYIEQQYLKTGIPLQADLYLEYYTPEINDQIDELIANIEANNRLISIKKDNEYNELRERKNKKEITDEKYKEELIKLNIKQLKNLRIVRETLINELTEAQKDKSAFSMWVDPIIHSSQVGIQAFSLMLKNKFYQANDLTRETIDEVGDILNEFKKYKGSPIDVAKFNEDIIEVHEYYTYDKATGKNKRMRIAGFVQPYDVTKFKKAEIAMYEELNKKYNKPPKGTQERKDWQKTPEAAKWREERAKWYADNTVESPDSKATLKRLLTKKRDYEDQLQAAINNNASADIQSRLMEEIAAVSANINMIYDSKAKIFLHTAVQPNDKYKNPKYEALQKNKAAFDYHQSLLKIYHESQKKLGNTSQVKNSWEKLSYALPSIESDGLQKVQQNGAISSAKMVAKENLQFLSTDTNYGDLINANKEARNKFIPIFYVNPTEADRVSKDVAASIVLFAGMANMFEMKQQMHGVVMAMRDTIESRTPLAETAAGNPIVHKAQKMLANTRFVKKEDGHNTFKQLAEFIDAVFYGEKDLNKNISVLGKEMSSTKLANKLVSYSAMNTLAFNMLQITNQAILDNVRLVEEGAAKQFFSTGDLAWAKTEFHVALGGIKQMQDAGAFSPNTKIVAAIEDFDAMQDAMSVAYKKKSTKKAMNIAVNPLMLGQHLVENETAVTRMLAVLRSYKGKLKDKDGKVILNKDGKPANLWELYEKNPKTGRFEISEKVVDRDKIKVQIRNRLSGLTKKTNQVKSDFERSILERRWYGKLLILYRRFFMPSLRRHWGHGNGLHRDLELGVLSEGIYSTAWRFIRDSYGKYGNVYSAYKAMSPMEQKNMKRLRVQAGFYAIASVLLWALASDDDDEEKTFTEQFLIYQALRLQAELIQFARPDEFLKMVESPTAVIRTVHAAGDILTHILTEEIPFLLTGDDDGLYYKRRYGIHEKGDSKLAAKVNKLLPIINGFERSQDPETASKWFFLGAGSGK